MKIITFVLCAVISLPVFASQVAKISLGVLGPQGFLGANIEKILQIDDQFQYAPTIGIGADPVGFLKTAGIRGYKKHSLDTEKWYDRCLFIFKQCEAFYSASGYVHHIDSGTTTVEKSGEDLKYKTASGWLSSLSLGTRSIIDKKWIFDFELSKRFLVSGMSTNQVGGTSNSSERQSIEDFSTTWGFSFGFGYLW